MRKLEHKGETIFDIPFEIQSHAEIIKKILGPLGSTSQSSPISQIMAELAMLVSLQVLKGSQDLLHTFRMALYHKYDVKNGFAFVLQLLSLISDDLGHA